MGWAGTLAARGELSVSCPAFCAVLEARTSISSRLLGFFNTTTKNWVLATCLGYWQSALLWSWKSSSLFLSIYDEVIFMTTHKQLVGSAQLLNKVVWTHKHPSFNPTSLPLSAI
ncbi:hypothetical protein ACOMHN_045591 [Nucella lapillus]